MDSIQKMITGVYIDLDKIVAITPLINRDTFYDCLIHFQLMSEPLKIDLFDVFKPDETGYGVRLSEQERKEEYNKIINLWMDYKKSKL